MVSSLENSGLGKKRRGSGWRSCRPRPMSWLGGWRGAGRLRGNDLTGPGLTPRPSACRRSPNRRDPAERVITRSHASPTVRGRPGDPTPPSSARASGRPSTRRVPLVVTPVSPTPAETAAAGAVCRTPSPVPPMTLPHHLPRGWERSSGRSWCRSTGPGGGGEELCRGSGRNRGREPLLTPPRPLLISAPLGRNERTVSENGERQ